MPAVYIQVNFKPVFWGRMLASGFNYYTYSFSVTSIFHPCQAKTLQYATILSNFQSYKLHGFNINNLIRCMIISRIDPDLYVPEKPTDPDLQCVPERGICGFRRIKA